ncbi:MAG: 2-dehydropantoate 2-reductase [Deltaproteobacteria bacterium]|nr:2-dehydropantoate 2-reductase [Deltaproteobacteria bacterium]
MKVAIMATGGVGGYYGGLLAQTGQDVTFIARGAHLQAIREKGLHIKSVHGDFQIVPAKATDNPSEVGPVDVILFATKTHQTDEAAKLIKPMVGRDTVIISLQNGIDAADRIGDVAGREHMLGGATWLSAAIEAPGVIGQYSQFRRIVLGEFNGRTTPRLDEVYSMLQAAGATVEVSDNILKVLWTKFVFIAPVMAMGSLTRVTFGEYRSVPEARAVLTEAIGEVAAVAQARGVTLDTDVVEKTLAFIDSSAPGIKPSMQRDVESGKPSELESMIGVVVRMGAQHNVSTPVMQFAYAMLKPGNLKAQQV